MGRRGARFEILMFSISVISAVGGRSHETQMLLDEKNRLCRTRAIVPEKGKGLGNDNYIIATYHLSLQNEQPCRPTDRSP
jgi:hypothetical protein